MNKDLSLLLLGIKGIGTKKLSDIWSAIEFMHVDVQELLADDKKILELLNSLNPKKELTIEEISLARDHAKRTFQLCTEYAIGIMGKEEALYPKNLAPLPKAPFILYYKGNPRILNEMPSIAVIGTRTPSNTGAKAALRLGAVLGQQGVAVVSGLALGCDTQAHKGCLSVGGHTVAVLAEGLDAISPSSNWELANEICANEGCLLSEYPPLFRAQKGSFVQRDYLESGISTGVIMVEASLNSGTMHTIKYALEQKRQVGVFVSPKSKLLDDNLAGNALILEKKQGQRISSKEELDSFLMNCFPKSKFIN